MAVPEITLGALLLKFIKEVAAHIKSKKEKESERAAEVLKAIRGAAGETLKYERWRRDNGDERDSQREMDISLLWYQASYPVQHFSPVLSERMRFKGAYWQQPKQWTELEILSAGIELTDVVDTAERLLKYFI